MLAFITKPAGIVAYQLLYRELAVGLRALGAECVLGEDISAIEEVLLRQDSKPVDAQCEALDARVATIRQARLLVALLDGTHPDVLVDLGIAYALGIDCYGLQISTAILDGVYTRMLDGHARDIPELLDHLGRHLRMDTAVAKRAGAVIW